MNQGQYSTEPGLSLNPSSPLESNAPPLPPWPNLRAITSSDKNPAFLSTYFAFHVLKISLTRHKSRLVTSKLSVTLREF